VSEYRMLAGMAAFIVIVLAIIGSASVEYPEIAGAATSPSGTWPPDFPEFGEWTPDIGTPPACDAVVLCINVFVFWFSSLVLLILDGILFVAGLMVFIIQLFAGLAAFAIHGLPAELAYIGLAIAVIFVLVLALFIIRLLLSAIPFVGA